MGEITVRQLEEKLRELGKKILEPLYGEEWEKHVSEVLLPLTYLMFFPQEDYLLPVLGELIKNVPVEVTVEGEAPGFTTREGIYLVLPELPARLPGWNYVYQKVKPSEYIRQLYESWRSAALRGELPQTETLRGLEEFAKRYNLRLPIFSRVRHEYLSPEVAFSVNLSPFLYFLYYPTLGVVLHEAYHWFAKHPEAFEFLVKRLARLYSWVPPELVEKLVPNIANVVADAFINTEVTSFFNNLATLIEAGQLPPLVEKHPNLILAGMLARLEGSVMLYDLANLLRILREIYTNIDNIKRLEELLDEYCRTYLNVPASRFLPELDIYGRLFALALMFTMNPAGLRRNVTPQEVLVKSRTSSECLSLMEKNVESITSEIFKILMELLARSRNRQQIINKLMRQAQQQGTGQGSMQSQARSARGRGSGRGQRQEKTSGSEGEEEAEESEEKEEEQGRKSTTSQRSSRRRGEGEKKGESGISSSEVEKLLEELGKFIDELYAKSHVYTRPPVIRSATLYSPGKGEMQREAVLKLFEELTKEVEKKVHNIEIEGARPPGLAPLGAWRGEIETAKRRGRSLINELKSLLTTYFGRIALESTYARKGLVKGVPGTKFRKIPLWILIDTSGSISNEELSHFARVLTDLYRTLLTYNPIFNIVFWDVEMYGPYKATSPAEIERIFKKSVTGGGGTLIYKALNYAVSEALRTPYRGGIIVLTDSYIGDIESEIVRELLNRLKMINMPRIWITITEVVPRSVRESGWTWHIYRPVIE